MFVMCVNRHRCWNNCAKEVPTDKCIISDLSIPIELKI